MEKEHPFTQALFQEPIRFLRGLLAEDRKRAQSAQREIANQETRSRLDRLAKAASRFLRQKIDQLEELTSDEGVDEDSFVKNGILIYPTFLNVELNQERELRVYVHRALLNSAEEGVVVNTDNNALEVIGSPFKLQPHKAQEDRLVGKFRVCGRSVARDVSITARCDGLPEAEALAQVIERRLEDRMFSQLLEFEHEEYRVRCGSQKTVRVYGKVPELIQSNTEIALASSEPTTVRVQQRFVLRPEPGTNYAVGELPVHGKRLKAKAVIQASLNGAQASTEVKVIERPEVERGPTIRIELRDEDFGNFRARWADHEGKSNVLLVAGRHRSLARYLGPARPDGTFAGQDNPIYRVLLAEIVAEAVCRKSLQLEARERPWDFRWADLGDDDKISDDVVARLQKRLREFLPIAHREMVHERDAKQQVIIEAM